MIRPKNDAVDLLLSIKKKCEPLIEQVQRKSEETLEFKKIKPRGTFHFNPPIEIKGGWMDPKGNNSNFNITEEKIRNL